MVTDKHPRLILASASVRRADLLGTIGIVPDVIISPDIDETELKSELPHQLAKRLAIAKNMAVCGQYQGDIVLTADTVIAVGRTILPKAETKSDFDLCMNYLSGGRHRAITAIAICNPAGRMTHRVVTTRVKVKRLTDNDIKNFYETHEWHGKAGGYALQGYFGQFVEMINGSYTGIIGLPLCETAKMLYSSGYHYNVNHTVSP